MNPAFLDFEQPIAELEGKIQELRHASHGTAFNIEQEIGQLQVKLTQKTEQIFAGLSAWQVAQLARHPQRPYTLDYVPLLFDEFHELAGDRAYADDPAIVGGLARIGGQAVMAIGHQKGRDTRQKIRRNFGMPRPEGYRKALRLMQTAERFGLPILTFIDTPGAYPGVGAEERGQSEAIARNFGMPRPEGYRKAMRLMKLAEKFALPVFTFVDTPGAYPGIGAEERGQSEAIGHSIYLMSELKTPIISTIIGEGGSGGALAIAVADRVLMLQYSTYSVISPEGCASILWKSAEKAADAAETMGITAARLKSLELVDKVVDEPIGGAHRDHRAMAATLKRALADALRELEALSPSELVEQRYQKLMSYGRYKEKAA